jgi:predicted transcriptional regulator
MTEQADKLALVAEISSAYLRRNGVSPDHISSVIKIIAQALQEAARTLSSAAAAESAPNVAAPAATAPAVPVRSSIKPDAIACLECGATHKTLKRHLSTAHHLTPAEYRSKWGLKNDYPMVAANYSAQRSTMAKTIGLGAKGGRRKAASKPKSTRKAA